MTEEQEDSRVRDLEAHLVAEFRVLGVLFGSTYAEHEAWARSCMPPDPANHYMKAWKEGRRRHWRAVERAAARLRAMTGDEPAAWNARLGRLEVVSEVQLADFRPTSSLATLQVTRD